MLWVALMTKNDCVAPRVIAYYLPQFHPIPENDEWWGKGFTEWTNVAKAKPLFPGHYQPHLPADLGFCDLRVPETRQAQADLAREYGIYGFCYYHYWFSGRELLERPLREVLESGEPDFPFCICWANENWTRRWDGGESQILMRNEYSNEDDVAHFHHLLPYLRDSRYITIDGKPLLSIYRIDELPHPADTVSRWRDEASKAGLPGLYVCYIIANGRISPEPERYGCDACVERHMNGPGLPWRMRSGRHGILRGAPAEDGYSVHYVNSYRDMVAAALYDTPSGVKVFSCVAPGWDNSPRRHSGARIYTDSTPELYGLWLRCALRRTCQCYTGDERVLFVDAWNEWGEGAHLEPDTRWGHAYLAATRTALVQCEQEITGEWRGSIAVSVPTEIAAVGQAFMEYKAAEGAALQGDMEGIASHLAAAVKLYPMMGNDVTLASRVVSMVAATSHRPWSESRKSAEIVFRGLDRAGVKAIRARRRARAELAFAEALTLYHSGKRSALASPLLTALLNWPAYLANGGALAMLATLILGRSAKGRLVHLLRSRLCLE